ncbi:hypothetical protein AMTR_s00057p00191600 [Amborella trichopoda]|uniref:Uncharacterized protein n=1 Tax=Amborella trichopoda TaxID=13333 RepID=U5D972_AMBTC|nr:hypothetical protein AMTR_s00057p00191600 [Amborella trichopoda]
MSYILPRIHTYATWTFLYYAAYHKTPSRFAFLLESEKSRYGRLGVAWGVAFSVVIVTRVGLLVVGTA